MTIKERGVEPRSRVYFLTPGTDTQEILLHPECAGHFFCTDDYHVHRDYFDSYLVMLIKAGSGHLTLDGKTMPIIAPALVLLDCRQAHAYGASPHWESLWAHINGPGLEKLFGHIRQQCGLCLPLEKPEETAVLFDELLGLCKRPLPSQAHFARLLYSLLMQPLISLQSAPHSAAMPNGVDRAMAFIHAKYTNRLTLEAMAQAACMSPYHFSRVFKQKTGHAPYGYLLLVRLNHAKQLLKGTTLSVKEIAFATGFASESNFSAAFKGQAGLSPGQFRKTAL